MPNPLNLGPAKTVGVIGAGTMGAGIAQVAATAGCKVYLFDANRTQTEKALQALSRTLSKLVDKQKMTAEKQREILGNIQLAAKIPDFCACDLVIEAVLENKEIKTVLFSDVEKHVPESCIIASNTSSISITALSSELKFPSRFIGIHFFNPASIMPLVEIIPGLLTDQNLPGYIYNLMESWGKTPIIAKDVPGFIVNRIARPFYGEALRIVEENMATPQQTDAAMKQLGGFKMGPFELMDLIGIDVNFAVTQTVYKDYFFDPKYKPSLLQQRMVEAKLLGRKTGKGFYDYSENAVNLVPEADYNLYKKVFTRIISMLINEAVEAKRLKIAADPDIEMAMQKGVNYPNGLLKWGEEIGWKTVSQTLSSLYEIYGEERYRQSPLLKILAQENV